MGLAGINFEFAFSSQTALPPESSFFSSFNRTDPGGETLRVSVTCLDRQKCDFSACASTAELVSKFQTRIGATWQDALHSSASSLLPALLQYANVTPEDIENRQYVFGYAFNTIMRYDAVTRACVVHAVIDTPIGRDAIAVMLISIFSFIFPWFDGFLFHASGAFVDDCACLFFGESGKGKSTILALLTTAATTLSDERCIIRKINDHYYLFETPWWRAEPVDREITARSRPLILFCLAHATGTTSVTRLAANEALHKMMYTLEGGQQPMVIPDKQTHAQQMAFLRELAFRTPCFDLQVFKSDRFPEEFSSFLKNNIRSL